jgi:TraM recognition site of TraD and TraG
VKNFVRGFFFLTGVIAALEYASGGELDAAGWRRCGQLAAILFPLLWLPVRMFKRVFRRKPKGDLDQVLLTYPTGDTMTLGDWHRGIAVYGSIGTGKSSSSGLALARAMLALPNSSGAIYASNPDDGPWWRERFHEAGRPGDLKEFSPTGKERWNILNCEQKERVIDGVKRPGTDARGMTKYLMTIGESLSDAKGGKDEQFWKMMQERYLFCGIEAVRQGHGHVDAPALSRFFSNAAFAPDQLDSEKWKAGFHNQTLKAASERRKSSIEASDFQLVRDMFLGEFPNTDDRVRMSVLAGINNTLHALNSGMVREIVSTTTTADADDYGKGIYHLFNFPVSEFGASGKAIYAAAKYSAQRWILRRDYRPGDPTVTLWGDEFWHVANPGDLEFLSESRKHGGTLVAITQSINNHAIAMGDANDKRQSEAFTGLFGTKIFHVVDPPTAEYASRLVGQAMQETYGGNQQAPGDLMDQMLGIGQWAGNVNQGIRALIEPREFMIGRTGGKVNNYIADSWLIRSGQLFRDGNSCIRVPWSQR